jgi:spoIIIJ-associated protein
MSEENNKLIKETVVELLDTMGLEAKIEEERIEEVGDGQEVYTINLMTDDPNLLIGQYGSNLQSFQHIVNVIIRRKVTEENDGEIESGEIRFNIDVNDYKKQKKESIVKLADAIANQVEYNKNSVALRPMSAYERKIVHMEISSRDNLTTESVGDNLMRRVIIKYVEE